jgi:rSAM/selenodomain-associated transferase 2
MESSPFISVIIPAVNEAALLPRALNHLRAESVTHEIVVPVGPSYDGTASLAEAGGCVVIESPNRHRARQMNLGAARARGEVLLFLHADSVLPEGALERIADALMDARIVGGAFARRYNVRSGFLRATCLLAELRSRIFGVFLGDQAIFVRREVFEALGGFQEMEIFEDFDFSQRMRDVGRTITLRPPIVSSGRRFYPEGPLAKTGRDFLMTCRYLWGEKSGQACGRIS